MREYKVKGPRTRSTTTNGLGYQPASYIRDSPFKGTEVVAVPVEEVVLDADDLAEMGEALNIQ
eukprot:10997343-Prorocentrum_lima.AAC.1